jgi:hypothetical protein
MWYEFSCGISSYVGKNRDRPGRWKEKGAVRHLVLDLHNTSWIAAEQVILHSKGKKYQKFSSGQVVAVIRR